MSQATNDQNVSSADPSEATRPMPSLLCNISWLGFASVLVKPFWFVFISAACMRLLGVHEYGVMTAALSLGIIASAFVDLGMIQYTMREVSRSPGRASRYFSNLMILRTANSVVAGAGGIAAALLLGYRGSALLAVLFATLYALSLNLTNYCRGIYRAFEDLRQEGLMLVIEKILVVGGGVALLIATRQAFWTLAGMACGMVVTTVVNTWWIDRHFAEIRLRLVSWRFLKHSVRTMIPFGLAGLFTVMYYRVDMVMVEALLGEGPTGQYGAAYRILEALNMLPTIVAIAAVYPRLSRLAHDESHRPFWKLLTKSMVGLVGISVLLGIGITISAPLIIHLLDPDPAYGPASGALQILVWSFPFFCANSLLYASLISLDLQRMASAALGVAVLVNIALNAILIPQIGINGAAFATIIPEVLLVVAYSLMLRHRNAQFATQ